MMRLACARFNEHNVYSSIVHVYGTCPRPCTCHSLRPPAQTAQSSYPISIVWDNVLRPAQVDLYSLSINQDTGVYTFMENVMPEVIGNVSADTMFFEEEVAVQKVVWNPNPSAASWVASGGTSGLVRVESTYGLPTDV
ncbi:hypothetical protein BC832DRAFT_314573 [Gaertneriomyces semiglobifer]|nr:hypothetical protein BC832DRAFT_314573 [Gaertneriomyces semiglobifer]